VKNSPVDSNVRAEGGGGDAPCVGEEIPVQPMQSTTPEQASVLDILDGL